MPHRGQKRLHAANISVEAVAANYSREDDRQSEPDLNSSSGFNDTSLPVSDVSDEDPYVETDGGDGESLEQLINFKVISKEKVLLCLKHDTKFYFKGKISVKVLKGKIEILGSTINPSSLYSSVYSPRGYSLLYIHGLQDDSTDATDAENDLSAVLMEEGVSFDESKMISGDCILIVKNLRENWSKFVHDQLNVDAKLNLLHRDSHLPVELQNSEEVQRVERLLDVNLIRSGRSKCRLFQAGEEWGVAVTSLGLARAAGNAPRLVAAGGKGVGKSTFLRWLTNKLLADHPGVVWLDLDPGQAELGPPGYLSLATVTQPLLGPNFSHIGAREVELSVCLGEVSAGSCPGRYTAAVARLAARAEQLLAAQGDTPLPLLVNTMGWTGGLGLLLLVDTVRLLRPTTVVQLTSRYSRRNFPYQLDCSLVSDTGDCWSSRPARPRLHYSLLQFPAVPESATAQDMRSGDFWGLPDPRTTRAAALLGFLGRTGWSWPVYRMPLGSLVLGSLTQPATAAPDLLALASTALVDLSTVDEREIVRPTGRPELYSVLRKPKRYCPPSLGLGLVRNIDMDAGLLYLATPLPPPVLTSVNCLLVTATRLPDSLLTSQTQTSAPYLAPVSTNPLDTAWQRSHKPRPA